MDALHLELAPAIHAIKPLRVVAQPSVFREPSTRNIITVPHGATLLELVLDTGMGELRDGVVHLLGPGKIVCTIDGNAIEQRYWRLVRPAPGRLVNIYLAPQGQREAILIGGALAIGVLAIATGGLATPFLGVFGASLLTAGIAVGGNYALTALVPLQEDNEARGGPKATSAVTGDANPLQKDALVPTVLASHIRVVPMHWAKPYTEAAGDDTYWRMLLVFGQGPLNILADTLKAGDTVLNANPDAYDFQIRQGRVTEDPLTLFTQDITEINPANTFGELFASTPQVQTLQPGSTEATVDITFPQGIYHQGKMNRDDYTVTYSIARSPTGANTWTDFRTGGTVQIHDQTHQTSNFIRISYRATGLDPNVTYDVEVRRRNGDGGASNPSPMFWTALRSIQPNDPRPDKTLACVAIRAKKTGSGTVPVISAICRTYAQVWNGSAWVEGTTGNPASLGRLLLQGAQYNPTPASDAQMDLPNWEDFYERCVAEGFEFNGVFDDEGTVLERLSAVLAAGRARLVPPDTKYAVAIDRNDKTISGMITPRNSFDFKGVHYLRDEVQALRVRFINETTWQADERMVYADGYDENNVEDGHVETYDLSKSGITDPDLAWRFGRWRLADMALRLDLYEVSQGIENLQHVPGDLVAFQHHAALLGLTRGRIKSTIGDPVTAVTIDDLVTMEAGKTYAARVRLIDDSGVDQYVERAVLTDVGGELFAEPWTGSNGDAWPTARWNAADPQGTGSVADIQSNAGRLLAQGEAGARARIIAKSGSVTDFELTAQVTIATGDQTANNEFHNLNFRASGGWSTSAEQDRLNGYSLEFRTASGVRTFQLVSVANSTRTTLGSVAKAFGTSAWEIRLRCVGSALKAKAWQGAEPGTWDIEVTDAAHASGDLSFSTVNGADGAARTATWDDLEVESLTSTHALRFTVPFDAGASPQIGDLLAFGETSLATVNALVKEVIPGPDKTARVLLVDEAPAVNLADTGTIPPFSSFITIPGDFFGLAPAVPVIDSINVENISHPSQPDLITKQQVLVNLAAVSSELPPPTGYDLEVKRAAQEIYQRRVHYPPDAVVLAIEALPSDVLYDVRVRAVGRSPRGIPNESAWSAVRQVFVPLPAVTFASTAKVTGLELQGQGNDVTFEGPDAHFVWRVTSTSGAFQIHGSDQQLVNFVDPQFAFYEIKVLDPTNSYVRRLVNTTTPSFIYSLADNKEDSRKQSAALGGSNRPLRTFTVRVTFVDTFGRRGPGQVLTVSNPAPATPDGLIVSGKVLAINVRTDPPEDDDFEGTLVYVGNASGFDPASLSTAVFKDLSNTVLIADQPGGVTKFVRVAHADRFSQEVGDLNLTSEIAVVIESPEGPPRFVADGIRFTFQASANIVKWTSGTVYVLDGSTVTSESVSAGQATRTSGTLWCYYVRGFGAIQATTNAALANQPDRLALAIYYGGRRLTRINGDFPVANQVSERVGGSVSGVGSNQWVQLVRTEQITVAGNPVTLQFAVDANCQAGGGETHSIALQVRVQRISLTPVENTLRTWTVASDSGTGTIRASWNGSLIWIDQAPPAGTYTYRLQANFNTSGPVVAEDSDWIDPMIVATESLF